MALVCPGEDQRGRPGPVGVPGMCVGVCRFEGTKREWEVEVGVCTVGARGREVSWKSMSWMEPSEKPV